MGAFVVRVALPEQLHEAVHVQALGLGMRVECRASVVSVLAFARHGCCRAGRFTFASQPLIALSRSPKPLQGGHGLPSDDRAEPYAQIGLRSVFSIKRTQRPADYTTKATIASPDGAAPPPAFRVPIADELSVKAASLIDPVES